MCFRTERVPGQRKRSVTVSVEPLVIGHVIAHCGDREPINAKCGARPGLQNVRLKNTELDRRW